MIEIKLWKTNANVIVYLYWQKNTKNYAALKKKKRKFSEKNRRFVVSKFVKTCDELVKGFDCFWNGIRSHF